MRVLFGDFTFVGESITDLSVLRLLPKQPDSSLGQYPQKDHGAPVNDIFSKNKIVQEERREIKTKIMVILQNESRLLLVLIFFSF